MQLRADVQLLEQVNHANGNGKSEARQTTPCQKFSDDR
jgi:hypothetical protein